MKDIELWCGDCLELLPNIPDKSVDMIFTDLPYGTTQCRWDCLLPLNDYILYEGKMYSENNLFELCLKTDKSPLYIRDFFRENKIDGLWSNYIRIGKDNAAIVLFGSQPFTSELVNSNLKMFKYEWIYEKTQPSGHLNAKRMPMKYHENILVFYKKQPIYNPIKTFGHKRKVSKGQVVSKDEVGHGCYGAQEKGANYDSTERYPKSIQVFSNGLMKQRSIHSTQKPLELCEYMIRTYTNEGNLVLDSCMGSNTAGLASKNLNRRFIGIEKEKDIFEIAKERIGEIVV